MPNLGFLGFSPCLCLQNGADKPNWVISMTLNCEKRGQMSWDHHTALVVCSHLLASLEKYVQSFIVQVQAKYLGEMPMRAHTCIYFSCLQE